ncbi:MAG: MarR family winged helix-turn-helix transcriptional regulator [Kiloniellaceae bacterium]
MLDEQIAHLIRRAHQRASATFNSVLSDYQITPAQFFAMARLREKGQLSQNLLGRLSAMDPATIQGVMRRLHDRGFIERLPDPTDRRRMILRLTPAGKTMIDGLAGGIEAATTRILAPLAPNEQEQLRNLLKRIV